MNELQLSKRLETVASFIPKGCMLADIGSDHAYLPCYAYLHGYVKGAIAGEVADGPLRSAQEQVKKSGLAHVISVRKGDGLQVIEPNEVDCITIAGMGGTLITNILDAGKEKLIGVKRLILQPNVGAHIVRRWLLEHDWELITERILEEDGRIYEVLVAEKGDGKKPYEQLEVELLLGPFLIKEQNEAFRKKWTMEMNQWRKIIEQLKHATTKEADEKKRELTRKLKMVEEALR
ncbi:tRNA (adenine22-N1)-methyltransferase [Thermolongibacillus altinsuensis]|uniref:tRNA (Adenine22-N1)-methyltransferase n=1 Tax=Thermolongibacillus altinsuensis TaxID=575256 RepID=A0A4R1QGY8_9BACL|nr:tRNA (adenine(22)-N(1))-methyltransferase TrmK [Thermolongibacillus altinsuensis]TCL48845.1 tRNA (adenine22-N1)-methyltransferase [Thermolongibacillus altinsuensis]GMB07597.1 SAM-dependent methyltransferase [Thermolongibacillus altinsuensis]